MELDLRDRNGKVLLVGDRVKYISNEPIIEEASWLTGKVSRFELDKEAHEWFAVLIRDDRGEWPGPEDEVYLRAIEFVSRPSEHAQSFDELRRGKRA